MTNIAGKTHDSRPIHLNIDTPEEEKDNHMLQIFMKQYSLKKVLKKFNKRGEAADTKETNSTARPINLRTIGYNQTS